MALCDEIFHDSLEALNGLFRAEYPHLSSRGEHPAIEVVAQSNGGRHFEMFLVNDLDRNIFPKAVNDAAHKRVLAQQLHLGLLTEIHGKGLPKVVRDSEVRRAFPRRFLCHRQLADPVHPIGCYQLPLLRVAHHVILVVVPEHSIGRYGVELPTMPVDFLFLRRVVEVLESDLLPLDDGGVEVVYDQDNGFIGRLGAVVYVELALQELLLLRLYEHAQLADQCLALLGRDKSGGLNGVDEQLDLRCVEVAGADEILILHPAVYDDVHAQLDKLIYVGLDSAGVRAGEAAGLQMVFELL